jgi:molybdate transport system substrate-binding protein
MSFFMTMKAARKWPYVVLFMLWTSHAKSAELHIAAAANLSVVMPQLSEAFEHKTAIHVVPSFGATAQLTQQIENGAPFDVFLAADTEHIDELSTKGFAISKTIYARGQLVVWAPHHPEIRTLADLTKSSIRTIAVATPALAPYGAAAIDTLKQAGLWDKLQRKVVYAPSIAIAKQFADTGNAEAAFTALALTINQKENQFEVKTPKPIDQAAAIIKASKEQKDARAFMAFLASPEAREILHRFGYADPVAATAFPHSPVPVAVTLQSRDREGAVPGPNPNPGLIH